ncbi:MAG: ChaN family lipoprotein [Myxococcota bacterium]|nr:ChaN family lipoprotein [Myxococcota bacterium]
MKFPVSSYLGALLIVLGAQVSESAPTPVDPPSLNDWVSPELRDHHLVGLIWSESEQKFITPKAFAGEIQASSHVLLGERHDNSDHHRLQAWVVSQIAKYREVVVGFEMLDEPDKEPLKSVKRVEQFADAVRWSKSGWPKFEVYAPLFEAVYRANSSVLAVHPSRKRLMGIARSVKEQPVDTWGTISQKGLDNLVDDITKSHCGYANESMVAMMTAAQRFKDHWMVKELREQSGNKPFVLVAGNGHVRKDYGVPNHLGGESISIGFVEVYKDLDHPQDYDVARFDYVWFTPRVDNLDPCEKYKEQLEKMKKHYQHKKK